MLKRAVRKTDPTRASFRLADLDHRLPFPDDTFDAVVSVNCLYALPRPGVTIKEFGRVLKPGGRLVIADPKAGTSMWAIFGEHLSRRPGDTLATWCSRLVLTAVLIPSLVVVGVINARIVAAAKTGAYTFRKAAEWQLLLSDLGFEQPVVAGIYADQGYLVTAVRPGNGGKRQEPGGFRA